VKIISTIQGARSAGWKPAVSQIGNLRGASNFPGAGISDALPTASRRYRRLPTCATGRAAAFTLVEILVVMVLLSVIVLGLMAMFNQVQRAFRAGMAQTDQLEGGRMFTDLILRDLQQITPSGQTNGVNFYAQIPNYPLLQQILPASSIPRTNILENLFFLTRMNQTWTGVGYMVRTNSDFGLAGYVDPVGTLYRFETNMSVSQFNGYGELPYFTFLNATNRFNISKVLDGVVEFRVRCYDPNGTLLVGNNLPYLPGNNLMTNNNFVAITNSIFIAPGEVESYAFSNNIVPAYVEVELGVLEPAVLKRYNSIPAAITRSNFLANHAGNVQLFRQRIAIRNVDPSVYSLQ
jgi:type II secretory pathway pseudopilin PulG